ncbi:type IX secretion system sortase PorU [Subsaximicrobium wynnwilliamsii]|uniref:Type IX secretion system sortase PorU n=1 Tax=Subsaximicrobium wynnwilliamsii TaxID=291179 RepID=A0A5C6ZFF2_9FLAO|nr:type IX secretion system sortase PorU [Subsaximicrobium wynnwilliamsii]TXD82853.1 type IX secretion system sortase PorU [Subsaximicrobium wynnwilliamsii]TXD88575.1 type IX secretion system sortase PorU [Subsaximicrobium wynnwilliamsii]TXE02428.1 type IX secretion system sortase PorU [Subsaximicrobium wynnwilliamsii]
MKKSLPIFLILCSVLAYAQQKKFEINWQDNKVMETETTKMEVPAFDAAHFSFSEESGLKYFAQWKVPSTINSGSLKLSNLSYSVMSANELKDLPSQTIPGSPNATLRNAVARDNQFAFLEFSPIIKENGIYKKITGFVIDYSYGSNSNLYARNNENIENSVLSSGSWHKFYVDKSGVFKLSKSFLDRIGVNTNVDPRTIKIFGNGGAMLPLINQDFYPLDLTENAIKFVGEEDGTFDTNDYILFYAEGPREYNDESNTNINLFTDKSHYFVNVGAGTGKRIAPLNQPSAAANLTVDTFQDYQFYETDEYNIGKLGRRWFGDRFDVENQREYKFNFPNLVSSEPARVKVLTGAVNEGNINTTMSVVINGQLVNSMTFAPLSAQSNLLGSSRSYSSNIILNAAEVTFNLSYDNAGNPTSVGYLDYISIEATRQLRFEGAQFPFYNKEVSTTSGVVQYNLSNAANVQEIWDITDKYNVASAANLEQTADFSFKETAGSQKKYVIVSNLNYYEPLRDGNSSVANQNLKGTIFNNTQGEFEDVDYLIVTPTILLSQAQRLAQINRDRNNLNVKVVTLDKIYTEFSSGNQDIAAIRNFVRYIYQNASSPANRIKYVCLFGDSSYDYKDRLPNNTNLVPSWHSNNAFSLTNSFVSDDFFGMMDPQEGSMVTSDRLDIAMGRILAETPQRAKDMIDKVETYYAEDSFGSWRNNIVVISDDIDKPGEQNLQLTTDAIADEITTQKPFINDIKIHSDAFQQQATASGERYPAVNKAIKDAIEVGALVVNYFGHGGEDGLAAERIFTKVDAQEIRNICKYHLFVTVTCEYTKFDNPQRLTAGEFTYWNKEGGAIGLITTTRRIFLNTGVDYNVVLEKYLFAYGSNEYPSMAEALRQTKNDNALAGNPQKTLVFYIGDPAMKLAIPKPDIKLSAVNDVPLDQQTEVLEALGRVKMSGKVYDSQGNFLPNYNGVLTATVFDKEIQRQTLANDGTVNGGVVTKMDFRTLGETIFRGQATVTNGNFDFNFVVPRDIGVPVGNGRVSFYSKQDNILDDKSGFNNEIQVGGINENAAEDNIGPVINLYMNDENFVSGGITNEQPTLLAKLQDDNGINTASGIGHDITAIIDGDEINPFILNDYYQANVDDYQNGKVSYPFRDLEPGLHTLTLKAWDVYNNAATAEIDFVVRDKDEELVIENVLNYPNPFIDYTEFWFNHNSSDVLDVSVQIFTVSGKIVRTLNGQTSGGSKVSSSLSKDIVWDGRDDFGDKIGKGVYIYKLKVRSNQLNKQVEKIEKLVIL